MDINAIIVIIQLLIVIANLISLFLLYKTIKSNTFLNRNVIFNELVKQERELRIKLNEYRKGIHEETINFDINSLKKNKEIVLDYDTLLFNYYEYLAICLHQRLINEKEAKLYFKILLKEVKGLFEASLLFKEEYAKKDDYKALNWLFRRWGV